MNTNGTAETARGREDAEAACRPALATTSMRVGSLPFSGVPNQTKLFLDYLQDPLALNHFYPNAVRFHHELAAFAPHVTASYTTNRTAVCDALARMNTAWGAGEKTLANIEVLRAADSVAVVTGQQIGLFTGPLYTIHKALTAVKIAACLNARGVAAVPIFWMASEDHDWDEVSAADFLACDARLARVEASAHLHDTERAVGEVVLDDSINATVERLFDSLPNTEFTPELRRALQDAYASERTYTEAFARFLTFLTARFGLVLLDPLDLELKRLAAPIYSEAARSALTLAESLVRRTEELTRAGYHAQVMTSADAFPLFLHADTSGATPGARQALTRNADGRYEVKSAKPAKNTRGAKQQTESWSAKELADWAATEPARFSPNVTLRAVVQDYLLPSVCYIGGAAEVSYFAQISAAYETLERPVTPILPRASLTVVEPRANRTLARYNLQLANLFAGFDALSRRIVEEQLGIGGAAAFRESETLIEESLNRLQTELTRVDSTLAGALTTSRRKIAYQIESLRTRFVRAELGRHRATHRQLERLFTALYPESALQERHLNMVSLLARHGDYCISWLYDSIDLTSSDHKIVYL